MSFYSHTGLVVTDLERAKRFYCEVFGFKLWYEFEPPEALSAKMTQLTPPLGMTNSYLTLDGFVLELVHYAAPAHRVPFRSRAINEPGLTHFTVSVDDIKATVQKVIEYGGQALEATDIGVGIFIRDPDGQLLEILHSSLRDKQPPKPRD